MANFVKKCNDFSIKNIPIPDEVSYLKSLIFRTEDFLKRMRWRALFFLKRQEEMKKDRVHSDAIDNDEDLSINNEKYGFRSSKVPPQIKELNDFEQEIWNMVEGVTFSDKRTDFQKMMKKEVNEIKNSKELIIPADKTANMYKLKPETYEKMLHNNITKDYRKSNNNIVKEINKEAKSISEKFKISDRVNVMPEKNAFITIKDHKENFDNDPKCRLINPTKSEIGKISKIIIQNINSKIREKSNLLQWRSTQEAIEWFENIETKNKKELIQCDIEKVSPSISKNPFEESLTFTEKFLTITKRERNAILHASPQLC